MGVYMNTKKVMVNLITALRGVGALLLIPIFFNFGPAVMGLSFLGFIATDFIDGFLARKFNCSTFFGAILDGMVDKIFTLVSLGLLLTITPNMIYPLLLELGILGVGFYSASKGNSAKSSLMGKLKVWIMALSVGGCFLLSDYHTLENIISFIKLPILDINDINKSIKFLTDLAIGAEAATLGSYIARDIKETNDKVRDNELKDNRKTLRDRLLKEKELLQSIKDNRVSKDDIKDRLFDTEFYQEHKDDSMRLILKKGHYGEN